MIRVSKSKINYGDFVTWRIRLSYLKYVSAIRQSKKGKKRKRNNCGAKAQILCNGTSFVSYLERIVLLAALLFEQADRSQEVQAAPSVKAAFDNDSQLNKHCGHLLRNKRNQGQNVPTDPFEACRCQPKLDRARQRVRKPAPGQLT